MLQRCFNVEMGALEVNDLVEGLVSVAFVSMASSNTWRRRMSSPVASGAFGKFEFLTITVCLRP
jgi:hypothetical protein